MIDQLEKQHILPKVIKAKKGIPTVIEWNGQRYVLDHSSQYKPGVRKPFKNITLTLK
ncbi:hypothetical protein [Ammoniphilus sp. 3BR4]|uniref:hypothetical protein n=1 Tax=Ammoniphilus sp. 3BR4 TaxID=3158265 RepID=UPI003466C15C